MSKTHYRFLIKVEEGKMRVHVRLGWIAILIVIVVTWTAAGTSFSKTAKNTPKAKESRTTKASPSPQSGQKSEIPSAEKSGFSVDAQSGLLMDGLTQQILYEQNPQAKIAPASFVKILTLYLAFDAIRAGQLKMDDLVTVSEKAWRIDGSKMFIKVGDRVRVEDLLKGIAIASGNDACIALAEHMAGSEEAFVSKINEKAQYLGMKDSRFVNSHGMPAQGQITTASDMALLACRYVADHPESLVFHSTTEYEYNGIRQGNRNTLLQKNIGVDGLKTGHVEESGYHLLATAKRDGQRMIAVVMGCDRMKQRSQEAQKLLEHGFRNFSTVEAIKRGSSFGPVKVKRGKQKEVMLTAAEDARVTVAKGKEQSVGVAPELPPFVVAPIQKNQSLAKAVIQNDGKPVKEVALLASAEVQKSLLPPWYITIAILAGMALVGLVALRWLRGPKQKKFSR
jgi:D-alanyl-D-alanine carboxypeptidase (penicillin-binding protein 5/6)